MSAAFALILIAEAAATCAPAPSRFAGGAVIVRPVGTAGLAPFKRLGPARTIEKSTAVRQTGAHHTEGDEGAEPPLDQCEAAIIHQV